MTDDKVHKQEKGPKWQEEDSAIVSRIIIAIGSNTDTHTAIAHARQLLEHEYGNVQFTRTIQTEPIGTFPGPFFNCLAVAYTSQPISVTQCFLKLLEAKCGDTQEQRKEGHVVLDADLLMHGDTRCHEADWQRVYIKTLMAEAGLP